MRTADGMRFQAAAIQKIKGTHWEATLFPKGDASGELNKLWRSLATASPNIKVVGDDYVHDPRDPVGEYITALEPLMRARTEEAKANRKDILRCTLCGSDHAVGFSGPNGTLPLCDSCCPEGA